MWADTAGPLRTAAGLAPHRCCIARRLSGCVCDQNRDSQGSSPIVRRRGLGVAALTIMQAGLGAINVVLLAPVWMQLAHLLVADLLWIELVLLSALTIRFGRPASRVRVDGMPTHGEALV
jgi:hypothetical protein